MEKSDVVQQLREKLIVNSNNAIAMQTKRYLKSPYEFYGLRVPELRKIAKDYKGYNINDIYLLFDVLWNSENHEEMSLAIFILQNHFDKFDDKTWKFIIERLEKAKTWDHIDAISGWILGEILSKNISYSTDVKEMAQSKNPWIRRAAIVSTLPLIRDNKIELTFRLAENLVYDGNVYVQKGAGWMLREAGKKNRVAVRDFILFHRNMKPIALSYATEKMLDVKKIIKDEQKALREEKKMRKALKLAEKAQKREEKKNKKLEEQEIINENKENKL